MRELVVLSGKGGTGKTSLTAAFASFARDKILCDADVDAADLHLLTNPDIMQKNDFKGGGIAVINRNKCSECGICRQLCRFEAIEEDYEVKANECEGCGVCVYFCPEKAIDFPIQKCGEWYVSNTRFGKMVHARLGIAEENSGKLVTMVRQEAKKLAKKNNFDLIVTDGPPGIGCPVIASMSGASAILIVAEPTVSGLHDMKRVADLASHFNISGMICINKYDLNIEKTLEIEEAGKKRNISVVGKIPFDPIFTQAMICGKTVWEYDDKSKTAKEVKAVWEKIISSPAMNSKGILDFNNIIK